MHTHGVRRELTTDEIVAISKKHSYFSWSVQGQVNPIPVARAKGVYFWDESGKRYLDMVSQMFSVNIGHCDDRMTQAISKQASTLPFCGPSHATRIRAQLCEQLCKIMPEGINKFLFTLAGADANENAVKMARQFTGRQKVITRYRSYHGATAGAMTLTGDPRRWANEPGVPGVVRIFDPFKYRSPLYREGDSDQEFSQRCLNQIEEVLDFEGPHTVAAMLMETVTGSNGVIVPPDGYYQGLRKICDKHGIVLIFDEILCGLGRTGTWFASEHWNVKPDIITLAKGLTSSYLPLGAVATNEKIANFFNDVQFFGGATYCSHPMCLAAADACLQILVDDDLCGNAARMGKLVTTQLEQMKRRHKSVGDVRSIGLLGAVELVRDRKMKTPMGPFSQFHSMGLEAQKISAFCKSQGVFTYVSSNYIIVGPPLCITEAELLEGLNVIDKALEIADQAVG